MKAAIYKGHPKLEIEDVPVPEIGTNEMLVRVVACGVCHTDLHYLDHGVPTQKRPPLILGHEISGIVEKVGSSVSSISPGAAVIIPPVLSCGRCVACGSGRGNICDQMVMFGYSIDGGFAEYVRVPGDTVFRIPKGIPIEDAAIIADAVSTPFHAVRNRAEVKPGDRVVVFGCGGVGINAVQIAAAAGGTIIAVDRIRSKLDLAGRLGAAHLIDTTDIPDVPKAIKKLTGGGADIAIDVIGNPSLIDSIVACVRPGGRVVLVGYCPTPATLTAGRVMFRELEIRGSLGCRASDYPILLDWIAAGRIRLREVIASRFPLSRINDAVDLLRQGEVLRTLVLA